MNFPKRYVQCTNCINVDNIFHGETQRERNDIASAIQNAVRKHGCSDFFRARALK